MTTFQQAITPETFKQFRALFLLSLAANGSQVNGWSTGAPQRGFLDGEARALTAQSLIVSGLASTAGIDTIKAAGSSWVDAGMTWFDLSNGQGGKGRFQATYAVWNVPMVITPSSSPQEVNNQSTILLQSTTGQIFTCTQQSKVELSAATSYKGTVQFTARAVGEGGNVTPGSIVKVISGPAGMSVDLTGTQVPASVARNVETDDDFIARGLGEWGRIGAGWTLTAFNYLIPLYGNNGTTLSVTRWSVNDNNPNGPGTVEVTLANAGGPATDPEVAAVLAGLVSSSVKPVGSGALSVIKAIADAITISSTITVDGSNIAVHANAVSAMTTLSNAFPIGPATLTPDLVSSVLRGDPIVSVTIKTGTTSKVIPLNLPGFASVIEVTDIGLAAPHEVALGDVLEITSVVVVLP